MYRRTPSRVNHVSWLAAVFAGLCLMVAAMHCVLYAEETYRDDIDRLILTDGSYELISSYAVQGDRVRYFSAERYVWEELPRSLIDWAETVRFAEHASEKAAERSRVTRAEAAEERRFLESRSPMVAPGIRLPLQAGVYLLDVYQDTAELVRLSQSDADVNKNMRRNILRGVINPISGSRQTAELQGARARIQSHVQTPELFFAVDPDTPWTGYGSEDADDHLRLVQCAVEKGRRVVMEYEISLFGKISTRMEHVPVRVMEVSEYWVKISPSEPLSPGEYALVEFDASGAANLMVWDFGVDPAAAANSGRVLSSSDNDEPTLLIPGEN
jgi:hypothetical protein